MENEVAKKAPKSQKKKRLIFGVVAVLAVVSAVGLFFGIRFFIDNQNIKIGDIVITRDQISKNATDIENALKADEDLTYGDGTPEEIARKDLILNALLKRQSEKCESKYGKISNIDLYNQLNYGDEKSEEKAKEYIDSFVSENGEFNRVRLENSAYKAKWNDCIIASKDVFKVSVILDMPYFIGLDDKSYKDEALKAQKEFAEKFLPLFEKGLSKEDIAKETDFNTLDESIKNVDISAKPVSFAFVNTWGKDGSVSASTTYNEANTRGNDILSAESESYNDIIKTMSTGEYTKRAIIGKNGEISIFRIESSSGEYDTWEEFYNKNTENLSIKTKLSAHAYGYGNQYSWNCGPGNTFSARGDVHYIRAVFHFRLQGSTGSVKGHIVRSSQGFGYFPGAGQYTCGLNYASHVDDSGKAQIEMNCLGVLPHEQGRETFQDHGKAKIDIELTRGHELVSVNRRNDGSGRNPKGGVSHWNLEGSLMVFYGANGTTETNVDVVIKKDVPPPPDIADKPDINVRKGGTRTEVRLDNRGNWNTGTILAPVGSTVNFKHTIVGSFKANYSDYYINWNQQNAQVSYRNTGRRVSLGSNASGEVVIQGDTSPTRNNVRVTPIRITHEHVGQTICENISYTWNMNYYYKKGIVNGAGKQDYTIARDSSKDRSGSGGSVAACVYVPYNYELTPCIRGGTSNCGGIDIPEEPGKKITTIPEVDNPNGNTPSRPDTRWVITTWTIGGEHESVSTPNNSIENSNSNTCSVYTGAYGVPLRNCRISEEGRKSFPPSGKTSVGSGGISIPENAPLGSRYCVALSVSPYKLEKNESQAQQAAKVGTQWRHSAPFCVKATKKPKLQVWGNGIYARGGVNTSKSVLSKGTFGSWVEYEAIAGGKVTGFTSESSNDTNRLTFANNSSQLGSWGEWKGATKRDVITQNILNRFPSGRSGVERQKVSGVYGGHQGEKTPNIHTRIIESDGGLLLNGNITSNKPTNVGNLKMFQQTIIIVNGDLYIHKDVTQVDAWLIVSGKIVTCADGRSENSSIVNNDNCGKSLQINGPVIANNLKSWRTGNSGYHDAEVPSEIYNQRADVYLWSYAQGSTDGKVMTTYTKELPVRY